MSEGRGNNPADAAERELVEAARRDPASFAGLYRHFFPRVYSFISRRVARSSDAEDLTSEVFHAVLKGLPGFEWQGVPFSAWIFRIAAYTIADHSARLAREGSIPNVEDISAEEVRTVDEDCRLGRLISMLPADQQPVLESRFIEAHRPRRRGSKCPGTPPWVRRRSVSVVRGSQKEKPVAQVARELGKSEGAVRQLQCRALESLRTWLNQPEPERGRDNG